MALWPDQEERFRALYTDERGRVWRLLYGMTGNSAIAEELSQEAFLKAWQGLPAFAFRSRLRTWLHAVAVNVARDWWRSPASRGAPADLAVPVTESGRPADPRVQQALLRLSQEHREVVVLGFWEEMEMKEMAAVLGVPVGTVKSRLHAAKTRLREELLSLGCDV